MARKTRELKFAGRYNYIDPSPYATCFTAQVNCHYQKLRIVERWNGVRLNRLCRVLQVSDMELASVVGLKHEEMERCRINGQLPLPVCLLLTMLEGFYVGAVTDIGVLKDIFPKFFTNDRLSTLNKKNSELRPETTVSEGLQKGHEQDVEGGAQGMEETPKGLQED